MNFGPEMDIIEKNLRKEREQARYREIQEQERTTRENEREREGDLREYNSMPEYKSKPSMFKKIKSFFTRKDNDIKIPTVVTPTTFNPPEIDIDKIYSDRVENYTFQRYDTYEDDCLDAIKMAEFALDAGDDYAAKNNYIKAREYYNRGIRDLDLNKVTD